MSVGSQHATFEIPGAARGLETPFLGKVEMTGLPEGDQDFSLSMAPSMSGPPYPSVSITDLDLFVLQQPS